MKIIGIENQEEKLEQQKRKKILITTCITIAIIVIIILVCLYMGNKTFRDFMDKYVLMKNATENNVTSISLESLNSYEVCAYDKYISILSQNTLVGYNISGKKEYELTVEISSPVTDSNGRFLLIGGKEKKKLYLISGNTIVWEKQLEGSISRVNVNKNGYVSVVLTGTTYKSIVQTFDNTGKELFKVYLSNSMAMDSDISSDNRYLSYAEVSTNGTLIQTTIKTIDIQKKEEVSNISAPSNTIALNLKYQDGNKLLCMYDNSIHCIQNGNDEEIMDLSQDKEKVSFAEIELNNYIMRIIEKSVLLNTESTIELINSNNKRTNLYTTNNIVKEVYTYDNKIALNLGSEVDFIGTNGWLIKRYISSQEVRKIVMNPNFAGIVYRNKIEIVEL